MPKSVSKRSNTSLTGKARAMAVKTDIFISIKTQPMNDIVSRAKNHEFRRYLISRAVERMWLYVSSPDQTLRYVATISKGKSPGEVAVEDGIGNAEFNNDGSTNYAYEILHLYKLRAPLPLVELRRIYDLAPPQRFAYLPRRLFEDVAWEEQEQLF